MACSQQPAPETLAPHPHSYPFGGLFPGGQSRYSGKQHFRLLPQHHPTESAVPVTVLIAVLDLFARIALLLMGIVIILGTFTSALRTFVLPRSAPDDLTRFVFRNVRRGFNLFARRASTYEDRDRIMAMYAPIALIMLPITWWSFVLIGYTVIYIAQGVPVYNAFVLSIGALTTLGFAREDGTFLMIFEFSEALVGLILIALLIAYLPTMYSAFSQREAKVALLEVRAGSPPSAADLLLRAYRIRGLDTLSGLWAEWEEWFTYIEENHTSLPALVFFRSPSPHRSWITAAGAVLDGAALYASTVDLPRNPQAELCIRSGYLALRAIADFFRMEYDPAPRSGDPISIVRQEFDEVYNQLAAAGLPLKPDREQCWRDFAGWRVNYDVVLVKLAALVMAPYAPWSSDRSLPNMGSTVLR